MAKIITNNCDACGVCADACPEDAITVDGVAVIDNELCVECGACVEECPSEAIDD